MSESCTTWADLCFRLRIPTGETNPAALVERVLSLPTILRASGTEMADVACTDPGCILRDVQHSHRVRVGPNGKPLL